MKCFKIPVVYKCWGTVDVEAETLEEAVEYANKNIRDLELPTDPQYLEDSYEICDDTLEYIEALNNN